MHVKKGTFHVRIKSTMPRSKIRKLVVAIDGPAGSGKSTIALLLAKRLSLPYIDTGAMYRSMALLANQKGIDFSDDRSLERLCGDVSFEFRKDDDGYRLYVNGTLMADEIRTPEISALASRIAINSTVRRELVAKQKAMIEENGGVVEGRDATTVICPGAPVKIYLTASPEVRARRRWRDLKKMGRKTELEEVLQDLQARDAQDQNRADSPLKIADGANVVDSSDLTLDEVTEEIVERIKSVSALDKNT